MISFIFQNLFEHFFLYIIINKSYFNNVFKFELQQLPLIIMYSYVFAYMYISTFLYFQVIYKFLRQVCSVIFILCSVFVLILLQLKMKLPLVRVNPLVLARYISSSKGPAAVNSKKMLMELRKLTGYPIINCRQALETCDYDFNKVCLYLPCIIILLTNNLLSNRQREGLR